MASPVAFPPPQLRSNLAKFGQSKEDKDLPLDLRTTSGWKLHGYRVWDIVEELVAMNTLPGPANPFEVDLEAFASMDAMQRTFRAGAMAHFLRELMLSERELKYIELVQKDLVRMLEIHFESVAEYVPADR